MKIYREHPKINDLGTPNLMCGLLQPKTLYVWQGMGYFKAAFLHNSTLRLDAKGMDLKKYIHRKNGKNVPLKYT